MKRALLLGLSLLAVLLAVGCGPRWTVIRQANPDPFVNHGFSVEPMHFDQTQVGGKSEAEYAAGKEGDKWPADKQGMSEAFAASLAGHAEGIEVVGTQKPGASIVRPIVTFIEPGYYAVVAGHATRVNLRVQFLDDKGTVQDEITMSSTIGASMTNPASGTRLRQAAEDLGGVAAKYLKTRAHPGS